MSARRSRQVRWGVGLSVATVVNLLLLAGLALQSGAPQWRSSPSEAPPIVVDLRRQTLAAPPQVAPPENAAKSPPAAKALSSLPPRERPAASAAAPALTQTRPPFPAPSASGPVAPPTPPAATAGDDQARTATALRRLGACARPAAGSSDPGDEKLCARRWADGGQSIDAIPTGKRIEYEAAQSRLSDLQETSAKVRKELGSHDVEGNNLHYGCTLIGGKVRCSSY